MENIMKSIFKIFFATMFFWMGTVPMPSSAEMSASERKMLLLDPYEWPRGFAARIIKMQRPTNSWNYDPLWYDLLSQWNSPDFTQQKQMDRSGKHKRMVGEGNGERDGGIEKRLFVARVGKRTAHVHWARVG